MFINIERPQNAKLCESHKRKALNMQASDCPGVKIIKMTEFAQSNIVAMIRGNAWESKNDIALTWLLIEAGGEGNHKRTHPMLQLVTKVREDVQQVTHLINQEKSEKPSSRNVGWEGTLDKQRAVSKHDHQRQHLLASSMQHQ